MRERILTYIRRLQLMPAGTRVAAAVSGGPDSMALARLLLEMRAELGIVLAIVHFNHRIRPEAATDQLFVSHFAAEHHLEFHTEEADVPAMAQSAKLSLEAAARHARYEFFRSLISAGKVDRVATGHTADDQAETVLLKFLRGAGSRGLAGIYPKQELGGGWVVRPLLTSRRTEIEDYLRAAGQTWREDASNCDTRFTRNRVRHELLPQLAAFNPAIVEQLGDTAGWALAEEEHWQEEVRRILPALLLPGKAVRGGGRAVSAEKAASLDCERLKKLSTAMQRRLIRAAAESLGLGLSFDETERLRLLASEGSPRSTVDLHEGWMGRRGLRELTIVERPASSNKNNFELALPVPGEVELPSGDILCTQMVTSAVKQPSYNHRRSVALPSLNALRVRNWRPGDRFWPAHSGSEKKVKELLQPLHLTPEQRDSWPLVFDSSTDPVTVVWLKGFQSPRLLVSTVSGEAEIMIEAWEYRPQS